MEPSPFPEEDDGTGEVIRRPWMPAKPLTQADLDYYASLPWEARTFNPWACMYNRNSEDGIGYYSGAKRIQCEVLLADPTKSRYCLEHAKKMGVDYYAPSELAEAVDKETSANLTRLVPKAAAVLEEVMEDVDAPQGVRAKAAAEVLDRTGYVRGVDVRVDAQIATVDVTGIIKDRLNALRDSMADVVPGSTTTVPGAIVDADERGDPDHADGTGDPDGSGDGAA